MSKQLVSFFVEDNKFFTYVLVIIGIYFAQTFFKIASTRKNGTFSYKELLNGMVDYFIYFVGIIIFFFAGTLIPNENIITFSGKNYSITDMLTVLAYALMVAQASKCFKNIKETFDISDEEINDINDKNASLKVGDNG